MEYDQLYMEYKLPEGNNYKQTEQDLKAIQAHLQKKDYIRHITASVGGAPRVTAADVSALEAVIDKYTDCTDRDRFEPVVPGASVASASLHVARTVARRCERRIITLAAASPELLQYTNRLSDLLFALAVHLDRK